MTVVKSLSGGRALHCRYLAATDNLADDFQELVGGVIWLVRNSQNYVNESLIAECGDIQETGQLDYFADVISARTAVGHDGDGRVVIAQVNGKTEQRG